MDQSDNFALDEEEILIIDDTPESLKLLTDLLISAGYRVRPTREPELGLSSALEDPPDLILLDIRMPGMDGYELCQCLMQDDRTSSIPVIFISALQDIEDRVLGYEVGGVDFIAKPINNRLVLAQVGTHLRLSKLQRNAASDKQLKLIPGCRRRPVQTNA